MNPTEITVAAPSEAEADKASKPAPGLRADVRLRGVLLIVAILLLAWLAFSVQSATNDFNATMQQIYDNIVQSPNHGASLMVRHHLTRK